MESLSTILSLAYIALFGLYIMFMIKIWRACDAIQEIRNHIKDLSFRDTARYIAEVHKGTIKEADQKEAQESFNN